MMTIVYSERLCLYRNGSPILRMSVFHAEIDPVPKIRGLHQPIIIGSKKHTVSCHSEYIWCQTVIFTWTLGQGQILHAEETTGRSVNNNVEFTSILHYNFTREEDFSNVTCSLEVDNAIHRDYKAHTTKRVNLYCK